MNDVGTPVPEYSVTETLSQGRCATLYRASCGPERRTVVLKVVDPVRCRGADLECLRREYEIGASLDVPGVVRPLGLAMYEGRPALVLEDFGGQPLERLLGRPMPARTFLDLAVRITRAVAALHERGVIHKDLKPANVLVHPATSEVKLADFGIATRIPREHQVARPPHLIEGTLPYLSPEQTGRMNRAVDSRTDLYSLGVIFYQMLTGRLPFEARDPLEWIHCHVARPPISPSALTPAVPETVSRVVMKLLAKMAEDRYQTARGLERDLARCLSEWSHVGRIESFALGERDFPGRLQIPQQLYGRAEQLGQLLTAFERVLRSGSPELVLVSGPPGIGKSTLVQELQEPIARQQGLFASGKFDPYARDVPYSTIIAAFRDLVLGILMEDDGRVAAWRRRLEDALQRSAQVIVDVIPQLELVIGKQAPVPELPPTEAQNRFRAVFRSFIGVFAQQERPLALFLDDLQWADPASLALLEDVVTHPSVRSFLVVGAYREVTPGHPMALAVEAIRKARARVSEIVLGPLSREHLVAFVADALRTRRADAAPLAEVVSRKTAANPFFAIQFLMALEEQRLIELDADGCWRWDLARIRASGFTENVLEFMVGKLGRLPPAAQEALKQIACLGNACDETSIAWTLGCTEGDVRASLWEALQEGLLVRLGDSYRFTHDRIQEAAYSLIPEESRPASHLRIGRTLLARLSQQECEERVFEVVTQLNRGIDLISDATERLALCRLDALAGRKARASAAYESAGSYLEVATSLLPADAWSARYEEAFGLHLDLAECEYLAGAFHRAEELLEALLARARYDLDCARVHLLRMAMYQVAGRFEDAWRAALDGLALFGVSFPETDPELAAALDAEQRQIGLHLGGRSPADLANAPEMTSRDLRMLARLLIRAAVLAYNARPACHPLVVARAVSLSVRHGTAPESAFAYAGYALLLVPVGDIGGAIEFSEASLRLAQRSGDALITGIVTGGLGSCVNHWRNAIATSIPLLDQSIRRNQEVGEVSVAGVTAIITTWVAIFETGAPLHEVLETTRKYLAVAEDSRNDIARDAIRLIRQLVPALKGTTREPASFDDDAFSEAACVAAFRKAGFGAGLTLHRISKQVAAFFYGRYEEALAAAEQAASGPAPASAFLYDLTHHLFRGLAAAALYPTADPDRQRTLRAIVEAELQSHELWARQCPGNFLCRHALLSAELARIEERENDAMRSYEQAIRSARENGFVQHEALAWELASQFYRAGRLDLIADTYLRQARACYLRWGADGKVREIERLHPSLVERRPPAPTATFTLQHRELDLLSVVKSSQAISSQIDFERLVGTLLDVVLEQGGAGKGYLVLARDGGLFIEAEAKLEGTGVASRVLPSLQVDGSPLVPESMIHYAQRTREPVILDDAAADPGRFASDPYFRRSGTRSALCLPIVRQELLGLLYLENEMVAGAFTQHRLTALSILAAQAAISVENALLLARERSARTAAQGAERRAKFLAETGELLAGSLDFEETLGRLSRLCVQSLADWCVLDLVDGSELHRVAGACADPQKEPVLERLRVRYPARWGSRHPAASVLRTGEPCLMPGITDEEHKSMCEDEEHCELILELCTRSLMAVPLLARGNTLGVLTLASATPGRYGRTDLELAQEVARRAALAMDNARLFREVQRSNQRKSDFIAVLSHELRNPLVPVRTGLYVLKRCLPDDPTAARAWEMMQRQTEHLIHLVDDLLDITRISRGKIQLQRARFDLRDALRASCQDLRPLFERERVELHLESMPNPIWLDADATRVSQVLGNLLQNAAKFTPVGGRVTVSVAVGGCAEISVRDTGLGMDPGQVDHMFEAFAQAEQGLARSQGGLGLGLALSKGLVELHGGSIRARSEGPGRGSEFVVALPLAPSVAADAGN